MKILQVNTVINTGSTGRIAEQIGERVLESNGTSYIAGSRIGNPSRSQIIKIGSTPDVYRHILTTRLLDNHGFSSKLATKTFIKAIENINPDVIHLHNIHGYYLHVGELFTFLAEAKKPLVWTFHDCWPFTGHCSYFDRFACEKWKTTCNNCPMKRYYPSSWLVDNSKNNFYKKRDLFTQVENLTIVTPSVWLKSLVKQSFFFNNSVEVIHNGIDLSIFKPLESNLRSTLNLNSSRIILGVANVWDDRKGFNDFLKLGEIIDEKYKIILVGLSKKQIIKLPMNIIGIERTENTIELVKLYSIADVYLNPTYSDNFPTTNIEALACGTPILTYNTGGSPEAIDNKTGLEIEKGDIKGALKGITTILNSKDSFTQELCRKRAEDLFNKNDRFKDYIDLYKTLLINNGE